MALTPHPVAGKRKSVDLIDAFIAGAPKTATGAVFYGVNESNIDAWRETLRFQRPFWYIDNSFFDKTRGTHFRVAKNRIQIDATQYTSDGSRFEALGIALHPHKTDGETIVVCPQSDSFMRDIVRYPGNWLEQKLRELNDCYPHRAVVVREWSRDKIKAAASLPQDLATAWRLVTHTSMAAVEALVHGVDVDCAGMHAIGLWRTDREAYTEDRRKLMGVLADAQWTIEELKEGKAWQWLNRP